MNQDDLNKISLRLRKQTERVLATLTPREREVLADRFGIDQEGTESAQRWVERLRRRVERVEPRDSPLLAAVIDRCGQRTNDPRD